MSVSEKYKKLKEKLEKALSNVEKIRTDIKILQMKCKHPNSYQTHDGGWGRMPDDYLNCNDCGMCKTL